MIQKTFHYILRTLTACLCAACLLAACLLAACRQTDGNAVEALPFRYGPDSLWGLASTDGTVLAQGFARRPSAVVGGMFSLPDAEGRLQLYAAGQPAPPVTPRVFFRVGHFFDRTTPAQETPDSPIVLIDKEGKDIASTAQYPQYNIVRVHNFSNGRALFATGEGKYGYLDTEGRVVIPPLYDVAYDFHEGIALAGMNNSQGETGYQLIDTDGQVTGNVRLSDCLLDTRFSGGRLLFKELRNGHLGFLDRQGDAVLYLPDPIRQASRFCRGTTVVRTGKGVGCMDLKGQMTLPDLYQQAFVAGDDRIAARQDGLWALLTAKGEAVTDFCLDTVGCFYADGHAVAKSRGRYLFIGRDGEKTGSDFDFLAEDSTSRRLRPQVFSIVQESAAPSTPHLTTNQPEEEKEKTALPPQEPTDNAPNPRPHTRIENQDWTKVTRQHPFYQEAAKVVSGKLEEQDGKNRRMILNYVEHLRTSYTTKDIDFLEQLFSENALIVVGTVVHTAPQEEADYLPPAQVMYNVKSKRQYLDRLKEVFKANRNIDVQFSDFRIMRHPTQPGIYGVSLRQKYRSDLYSDDGYLFLLWDFRDETAPKIHVRTWQPRMQPGHTPLPESEIFSIRNFNLQ